MSRPFERADWPASSASTRPDTEPGRWLSGFGGAQRGSGGPQVLAGADDTRAHARLAHLPPGPRIVGLLLADLAVDLQHAAVVLHHVVDDGPREIVLRVRVDVHLHHAVVERLPDLLQQRAAAAVEDEVERLLLAGLLPDDVLDLLEHGRTQLDVPGLVDAVH